MSRHRKGGGWIAFAGIVLILSGINTFLNGLWALGASNNVEESFKDTLLFSDTNLDTWGWIYLIVGAVVVLAGFALFARAPWARIVGIIVASIGAISAFFWLFNPNFWVPALVSVTLNLLVLHALVRYYSDEGDEATV
ncbi:MAG: hypothetical protein AMXMBFR46_11150 [Acidimicrobiia bacterium]